MTGTMTNKIVIPHNVIHETFRRGRLMTVALLGVSALALSACQTTGSTAQANAHAAQIDAALHQAASRAEAGGSTRDSLPIVEKLYKRNPNDVTVAVRYARALRENDRLSRASIVMAPFARDDRKPNAAARAEFSAIQASLGNYAVAEEFARKALAMNNSNSDAWHMLGIALDAQGKHGEAETAFRKALTGWQGDPAPVLNNLGLNLAAQGFLDEAAETLRKALATAPNREEIERNLRIVSALRESGGRAPSYLQEARDKKMNAAAAGTSAEKKPTAAPAVPAKPVEKVEAVKAPAPIPVPGQKPGETSFND